MTGEVHAFEKQAYAVEIAVDEKQRCLPTADDSPGPHRMEFLPTLRTMHDACFHWSFIHSCPCTTRARTISPLAQCILSPSSRAGPRLKQDYARSVRRS